MKKLNRHLVHILMLSLIVNILLFSGCATLITQIDDHGKKEAYYGFAVPRLYSGTVVDVHGVTAENMALFALVDLPFSLALDTVIFPYTAYRQIKLGNIESALIKK